jgi:hypothetical protein
MTIEHNSAASPPTLAFSMGGAGPFKPQTVVTVLNNVPAERDDMMMGRMKTWGQMVSVSQISDAYFSEGWAEDTVIETHEENSKDGWSCVNVSVAFVSVVCIVYWLIGDGWVVLWHPADRWKEILLPKVEGHQQEGGNCPDSIRQQLQEVSLVLCTCLVGDMLEWSVKILRTGLK